MKLLRTTALHIDSSNAEGSNGSFHVLLPWFQPMAKDNQTPQYRFKVLKALIGYDWAAMTTANNTLTVNGTNYEFIVGSPTVLDLASQINGFNCGLSAYFEPVSGRFQLTNTTNAPISVSTTATRSLGFTSATVGAGEVYTAPNGADIRAPFIVQLRATEGVQGTGFEAIGGQMIQSGILAVIGMTGPPYSLQAWDLPSSDHSFVIIENVRPRVGFVLEDPEGNPIEPNSPIYLYCVIEEWVDDESSIAASVGELTKLKRLGLLAKADQIIGS